MAPRVRGQKHLRDEDIIQDMRIAAAACPRGMLSVDRYNKIGRYHSKNAVVRFGSWNEALRRALPDVYAQRHPTVQQMIDDLLRVAEICRGYLEKGPPSDAHYHERGQFRSLSKPFYDKHGRYAHTYLINHLAMEHFKVNSWTELKQVMGITDV